MDHERAFLQAIREEPDDDAPRLIYADWLEEQGGAGRAARAGFIRAQCRLAVLPADDPLRADLEDEAADLLVEHEEEWTRPLHGIAQDWQFARGFVEQVTIRGEDFLTHAESLFAFTPLRAVHLLIAPKDVPHLAACPQLRWVESLNFRRCHLGDRSLRQLLTSPYLARLNALDVAGNGISTPGIKSLIESPVLARLTRLNLSRNAIGDKAVRMLAAASAAEGLTELGLTGTDMSAGLSDLFQSRCLKRLRVLNLSHTRHYQWLDATAILKSLVDAPLLGQLASLDLSETEPRIRWSSLALSPRAANLTALYLRGLAMTSADARSLAETAHLRGLKLLALSDNRIGEEGMRALASSPYLAGLSSLDVSGNNIRDKGTIALAGSAHLRNLTALDLARNGIGGPGLKAVASSPNLGRLRTLNLAGNFIGADSVRILAESPHLSRLSQLDLSDAYLEEDGARSLAASANLARLTALLLQKNLLGDAGAKALAQSPHLKRLATLDLNDNRIGKAGAEALAAAPAWRRLRQLDLRANVFTDTQEALLRQRFGDAVLL